MFLCLVCSLAFASVHCCCVVACWERADLLALVVDIYCIFVTFPCGNLGQVWYLIVSFSDLCLLSYLYFIFNHQLYKYTIYKIDGDWDPGLIVIYGTPEGTCTALLLSRDHNQLCIPTTDHDLLSSSHD